jgi:hypothetical protein
LVVVVTGVGGVGCHAGAGMLAGAGGGGILSGAGGKAGGGSAILGFAGAGPATGAAGYPDSGCGAVIPAVRLPARILIVLDTSASMNEAPDASCTSGCGSGSKWSAVVAGIDAVVGADDPSVNWGLEFIGRAGTCEVGLIEVGTAPRTGSAVIAALAVRAPAAELDVPGYTPTRASVNVATSYLIGLSTMGASAILLMTDGAPDCGLGASDPRGWDGAGAVQAITDAHNAGIPTFVAGIGAIEPVTQDVLSRMAVAGGFALRDPQAYRVALDATDVVNMMNQVVADVGTCMFAIPPPATSDGTTSREDISVLADGSTVPLDPNDGWTYGDSTHTTLTLHGLSCDAIRSGAARQVSIVFRCSGIP